ncbi:hypothetical protein CC2G_004177 [Coprinopsis cinerea AmutBmut pab1-1]|nr:hypothetical protein CC2G_004177 [Coprinopsis cinerea AmutBmut pab1-1]
MKIVGSVYGLRPGSTVTVVTFLLRRKCSRKRSGPPSTNCSPLESPSRRSRLCSQSLKRPCYFQSLVNVGPFSPSANRSRFPKSIVYQWTPPLSSPNPMQWRSSSRPLPASYNPTSPPSNSYGT